MVVRVCAVRSEKVGCEQELRAVKQELADVVRLNKLLREEMELIKEEHLAITVQVRRGECTARRGQGWQAVASIRTGGPLGTLVSGRRT